jgi:uncharacterized protein (DUF1501 family)
VGMTSLASTAFDLRRIAAASTCPTFKALVCVFLYGGNDSSNTVIPSGADYAAYAAQRGILALPSGSLLPIAPQAGAGGRQWSLHPALPNLRSLFEQGRAAIVANVGPLVAPITKADYENGGSNLPPQLFSHSDQTVHWQTSLPDQPARTGWGGRVADLLNSCHASPQVSMSLSLDGNNTFQIGNSVTQYQVSPWGSDGLGHYYDGNEYVHSPSIAVRELMQRSYGNLFAGGYRDVFSRALEQDRRLAAALELVPETLPMFAAFPDTGLGQQMRMTARLIAARGQLGLNRQVFFCAAGGYDTHGGQIGAQAEVGTHAELLAELDGAVVAFYNCMVQLGIADAVTTFTASDFGRTYVSNGEGSDHGWGAHHFVLGGAVTGRRIYGTMPLHVVDGPDDAGDGRWIPTTSVDEYSATLARWFGVSASELPLVLPNIGRFDNPAMGFLPTA